MIEQQEVERLERAGYNRGAAVKILAKVAYGKASIEQYEFAAMDLRFVDRLNAEADQAAAERAKFSAALDRARGGHADESDFETLLGFE